MDAGEGRREREREREREEDETGEDQGKEIGRIRKKRRDR